MSLDAMMLPGQEREPAPKEWWARPGVGFSVKDLVGESGAVGESQRSGLKVAASGPKWSISI
jgi:hypothetical protein